ncbi:MAG: sulfate adenylyltransferase subunit CysN [Alphaproteobacteria bacterium]
MDDQARSAAALADYLKVHEEKGLLRLLTCGSVDDGKSTLIGRLLYDTKLLFDDQLRSLERDSRVHGTVGDDLDFALLVDGLEAEREQGITIDVAYRFFATDKRKFIVADTPGHEQYTRNMATGASTADLAVLMIDARKGVLTQTRRHAYIAQLLGVRHVVVALNKMDLVGFSEATFEKIVADYRAFADDFAHQSLVFIPMSARFGDNVTRRSEATPWYDGPTLLEHLETVEVAGWRAHQPFRMAVQWVNRPNLDFRGFAGTIASGAVRPGDEIAVAVSGQKARVARIVTADGDLDVAGAGEAVTLTLDREIDVSRGDLLAPADARPEVSDQFACHVIWMHEDALMPGRSYLLKSGARTVGATVTEIKHRIDVNSFQHLAAKSLGLNEIAVCNIATQGAIAFDPYERNPETGAFILIDRMTNATVAAGMIDFGLWRATNVHRQALDVNKAARAGLKGQKPVVLWFTGLSGSGKSTVANLVEQKLHAMGRHTVMLDGDNVRHGLNRDLGFTEADRVENIRRAAEVAKLMVDAGLITLVSFISPFQAERDQARAILEAGEFVEVFVDTPIEECQRRDPKGLYKKALAGEIPNFPGVSAPYEAPTNPDIRLETQDRDPGALADAVVAYLEANGYLRPA